MSNAPELLRAVPVLPALDINHAIAFYEQRLGFITEFQYDEYAGLNRSKSQIHLLPSEKP
jgi:hypothetical protein